MAKKIKEKIFLIINCRDNVAVALTPLKKGTLLKNIKIINNIPKGHKIALVDFKKGETIIKYGEKIGLAKKNIKKGEHVHIHNLESQRGKKGSKPEKLLKILKEIKFSSRKAIKEDKKDKINGFLRKNGKVAIRNYIAVISTIVCANNVVRRITEDFPNTVAVEIPVGCGQLGEDHQQTVRTLIGLGKNANVNSVLVVENGCQHVNANNVASEIAKTGKEVEKICIQALGGTNKAIKKGKEIVTRLEKKMVLEKQQPLPLSSLIVGVECGGSDFTSGLAANPVVGFVADKIVRQKGGLILSETTELIGAEHLLFKRMKNTKVAKKLIETTTQIEKRIADLGLDFLGSQPGPGNVLGGLSTVEEKSLGCLAKAGKQAIFEDVLKYAQEVIKPSPVIMDTPGQDAISCTGMVAGGAVIVLFTTGRGTPLGAPLAPTIKITGNQQTFKFMKEDIDFNASPIMEGKETIEENGEKLYQKLLQVASGKQTKSEIHKNFEVAIFRIGITT